MRYVNGPLCSCAVMSSQLQSLMFDKTERSLLIKKLTFSPYGTFKNVHCKCYEFYWWRQGADFSLCQWENNLRRHQSRLFPTARNLNLQIDFIGLNKFWKVLRKKKRLFIAFNWSKTRIFKYILYIYKIHTHIYTHSFSEAEMFGAYQRIQMRYASRFWTI